MGSWRIASLVIICIAAAVMIVCVYPFALISNKERAQTYVEPSHDPLLLVSEATFALPVAQITYYPTLIVLDDVDNNDFKLEVFIDNVYVGDAIPSTGDVTAYIMKLLLLDTQELSFTLSRTDHADFEIEQSTVPFTLHYSAAGNAFAVH